MMQKIGSIVGLFLFLVSFPAFSKNFQTGPWRFELKTTYAVVPFVIDFQWKGKKLIGTLHNGKETIKLDGIALSKDNLVIPLQTYEQILEMKIQDKDLMTGYHVRHNKNPSIRTEIVAHHGAKEKYPDNGKRTPPMIDLNGKWSVTLTEDDGKSSPGVVVFEQKGSQLSGSILTPTGDYRYFNGFVAGEEFEAASFDGVFNYVFRGTMKKKELLASILSSWSTKVQGKLDPQASLPDAYKQTQVDTLNFKFPDIAGKEISLSDPKFKNKPVIVQFFGSWCPNCMDEMNFLIPWYNQNKKRGVEIIALAFERSLSQKDAIRQLKKVKTKKKIPYTVLVAGHTSKNKPMDKIPAIKNFISFPTTVFLNKKHEVVKVHAGFTGPSTGEFYENWKKEFNATVDEMLK